MPYAGVTTATLSSFVRKSLDGAGGGFNEEGTEPTGIDCQLVVAGDASREKLVAIAQEAFDESSIAAVLRRTTIVGLSEIDAHSTAPAG
jgi:hypothetical protein